MEIKVTFTDPYFNKNSRILGNCYQIEENGTLYHYEFILTGSTATIKADTSLYLEKVAKAYHNLHPTISIFKAKDFYMELESPFIFKLPISILQVSKFFLNQTYLEELKSLPNLPSIHIPVQIIDEEYVVLDNHHLLYLAMSLEYKMVDVYLGTPKEHTKDYLYLAKEQNIKTIQDVKCLPEEHYQKIEQDLQMIFSIYK